MNAPDSPALRWRKSSRSSGDDYGSCVEVADKTGAIAVRDSKDTGGSVLMVSRAGFAALRDAVRAGRHDLS